MSTFLITGGAGFIGSHLTKRLLSEKHKVVCVDNFNDFYSPKIKEFNISEFLDNEDYKLYRVDITDEFSMKNVFDSEKIDAVINLAAMAGVRPSIERPLLYEKVNSMGFQVVLECMRQYNIKKLIAASSSSVYGNNKKVPFSETDVVDFAISPYAATKKANEVMGHVFHKLYDIDMVFLRFFTVYGPGQRPDLAIHKFTRMIDEGKSIPLFGDGSSSRDYTYISDIIDGIIKTIDFIQQTGIYEIFNLGESTPIKLNVMVETIEKHLQKKANITSLPKQMGDVDITYADISKARKMLDYHPSTGFDEGIANFVSWYQKMKELGIYE